MAYLYFSFLERFNGMTSKSVKISSIIGFCLLFFFCFFILRRWAIRRELDLLYTADDDATQYSLMFMKCDSIYILEKMTTKIMTSFFFFLLWVSGIVSPSPPLPTLFRLYIIIILGVYYIYLSFCFHRSLSLLSNCSVARAGGAFVYVNRSETSPSSRFLPLFVCVCVCEKETRLSLCVSVRTRAQRIPHPCLSLTF